MKSPEYMSHQELLDAQLVAEYGRSIPIEWYPDGMPRVTSQRGHESLLLRPRDLQTFVAALIHIRSQQARGYEVPTLILPFVPGSRMDRLQAQGDRNFTVKWVAEAINALQFKRVVILDPHSDVTPALIERSVVVPHRVALDLFKSAQRHPYDGVIAPDAGAVKRATAWADALGKLPVYIMPKSRDAETGTIEEYETISLSAGRYLVVDDICDGGRTFHALSSAVELRPGQLDPAAVTLDLFVTHGLFSKGTTALLEDYEHIYCTDSVLAHREGVTVLSICQELFNYVA